VRTVESTADLLPLAQEAFEAARRDGPAALILPADIAWSDDTLLLPPTRAPSDETIDADLIEEAAQLLGPRTLLLLGGRFLSAETCALAQRLGAKTGALVLIETFPARVRREGSAAQLKRLPYLSEMAAAALSQMSDQGGMRQAVGDGAGAAAIGGYSAPSRGNIGSGLELLSDPEGVDFRPYLLQILNSVRRNWFAVIPESARIGLEKGRVALQFSISRQGDVPKLVISSSSRSQPLDRASVAGVSASLPFPPLPADFKGEEIRVQFVFLYNTKP